MAFSLFFWGDPLKGQMTQLPFLQLWLLSFDSCKTKLKQRWIRLKIERKPKNLFNWKNETFKSHKNRICKQRVAKEEKKKQ